MFGKGACQNEFRKDSDLFKQNIQNERKNLKYCFQKQRLSREHENFTSSYPCRKTVLLKKYQLWRTTFIYCFKDEPNSPVVSMSLLTLQGYVACSYDRYSVFGMAIKAKRKVRK